MDTTEQLNGTYFYKGLHNLSAGELFFWVFLGIMFIMNDVMTIAWRATNTFNRIAREEDKLWG